MASEPRPDSKLPISGIFVLAAAAIGGFLIYQEPLQSTRPVVSEADRLAATEGELVQARLWQDPFEAVAEHCQKEQVHTHVHKSGLPPPHSIGHLARVISESPSAPSRLLVLPVLVDGSPYTDGVESRLRHRYAVVSALGVSGYIPEGAEYIRFFSLSTPSHTEGNCPKRTIPVEWYLPLHKRMGNIF